MVFWKAKFQFTMNVALSPNVPQAGERPNFYKIVSSNIKLNFLNLMISSNLLMGWRLLAVSVSLVIFFRFISSINTSHQVYAISL